MKLVIFGLTFSSSWGNGHATLWRGLCSALIRQGHEVVFFERDTPYYAMNRDLFALPGGELVIYPDWSSVQSKAQREIREADAAIVTSYAADALAASDLIISASRTLSVFYDLDTPVTLSRLRRGNTIPYIGARGLADFDLVLSYTGGAALDALRDELGARQVVPLYGHVDPDVHRPLRAASLRQFALSYLGTYSADRQDALDALFHAPARARPELRFVIGGAQYPQDFPWCPNIFFVHHLPPTDHPAFYASSRLTLNVTRRPMADLGWCPSGRLFEATACGVPVLSDAWAGLETFFTPGDEILVARDTADALAAIELSDAELARVARAAREHTLAAHTSEQRAHELTATMSKTLISPAREMEQV
ncbi:glycosyltransferase [Bradyrhizobium sp. sGM-13]|uniref:CgeB family protein n=1 Tax=Bradyrhizobium sp. sGM-13 TaxID=2831781 RepID=UPI001BCF147B|nr:glycosyltransferase [Bradyrhizobium sp. sGM-13]